MIFSEIASLVIPQNLDIVETVKSLSNKPCMNNLFSFEYFFINGGNEKFEYK